jgi:hypothetical protein
MGDFAVLEDERRGSLTRKRQDEEFDGEIQSHLHMLSEPVLDQPMYDKDEALAAR